MQISLRSVLLLFAWAGPLLMSFARADELFVRESPEVSEEMGEAACCVK